MGIMKYQFDNHSNGDIYSSPDNRDPEDLRKIHEMLEKWNSPEYKAQQEAKERAERERIAALKSKKLAQCQTERDAAKVYPVKAGNESFDCPILRSLSKRGEKAWAVIDDSCFPVEYQVSSFVLSDIGSQSSLSAVLENWCSRGYSFERW
jgi:hypothetical protein